MGIAGISVGGKTGCRRLARAVILATALLMAGLSGTAVADAGAPSALTVAASPDLTASGPAAPWTRERMLAAVPMPLEGPDKSPESSRTVLLDAIARVGATPWQEITSPAKGKMRTNGKLFGTMGGIDYSCSATVVNTRKRNTLLTAGHCVYDPDHGSSDPQDGWFSQLTFVPGYRNGNAPLGQFMAKNAWSIHGWMTYGRFGFDVATVILDRPIEGKTGARKIDFAPNLKPARLQLFGYPAEPVPLNDGERLIRCQPKKTVFDNSWKPATWGARPCDIGAGASGGGWIHNGNFLVSVNSYIYCRTDPETGVETCTRAMYGPQLGKIKTWKLINTPGSGGTPFPTVRIVKGPGRKVRKRRVIFRVAGNGGTPITQFKVRLNNRKWRTLGPRFQVYDLSRRKYTVSVRSIDQTGRMSKRTIKRVFRVVR